MRQMFRWAAALMLTVALPARAEEAAQASAPRPVISEILHNDVARLLSFPGIVGTEVESPLAFQVAGRLAVRNVSLGDRVKAGELLASLDQISLKDDVTNASAALDAARSQAELARQNLLRTEELTRRGVATVVQQEEAVARHDSSVAAVTVAQANLARARDAETFGVLIAPSDGVVIETSVEPGSIVAPGQSVLTLARDDKLEVVISVPQDVLSLLKPDAKFLILPRQDGAEPISGHIRLIEPVADATTRRRNVHVSLEGISRLVRIGSLVNVVLALPDEPILSLPVVALRQVQGKPMVWRIAPDTRKAEAVPVVLGVQIGNRVVIAGGLAAGDEVLVRGVNSVTEGETLGNRVE